MASVIAASPFVADQMITIVPCSQGSVVCLFRIPSQMWATFSPR